MNKFWMVLRERGQSSPTKQHTDKLSAIEEATRLCKKEKENYYVLEAIGIVAPVDAPVVYTEIRMDYDRPKQKAMGEVGVAAKWKE